MQIQRSAQPPPARQTGLGAPLAAKVFDDDLLELRDELGVVERQILDERLEGQVRVLADGTAHKDVAAGDGHILASLGVELLGGGAHDANVGGLDLWEQNRRGESARVPGDSRQTARSTQQRGAMSRNRVPRRAELRFLLFCLCFVRG